MVEVVREILGQEKEVQEIVPGGGEGDVAVLGELDALKNLIDF